MEVDDDAIPGRRGPMSHSDTQALEAELDALALALDQAAQRLSSRPEAGLKDPKRWAEHLQVTGVNRRHAGEGRIEIIGCRSV